MADDVDAAVRSALERGDTSAATEIALRRHGPEIVGFLSATMTSEAEAADVFSTFAQDVWRGLKTWRGDAALRAWLYVVARRAAARTRRKEKRRESREIPLEDSSRLSKLAVQLRESTLVHQKTETKDRLRALRAQLTVEEQELLVLRLDRGFEWDEIVRVLAEDDSVDVKREAGALRKRFERLKGKIKRLAEEQGLLD